MMMVVMMSVSVMFMFIVIVVVVMFMIVVMVFIMFMMVFVFIMMVFVVIIISILVGSVIQISNTALRMAVRLLLLPIVVGISYEINRWVGRHDNVLSSILSWPGKQLQHLTTNEPDDCMMEVGIEALKLVIPEEQGADAW